MGSIATESNREHFRLSVHGRACLFVPTGISFTVFFLELRTIGQSSIRTYFPRLGEYNDFTLDDMRELLVPGGTYRLQIDFDKENLSPLVLDVCLCPLDKELDYPELEFSLLEGEELQAPLIEEIKQEYSLPS